MSVLQSGLRTQVEGWDSRRRLKVWQPARGASTAPSRSMARRNDCGTLLLCPAVSVFAPSMHGVVLFARTVPGRRAAPSLVPAPVPCAPRRTGTQEGGGNAILVPARHDCSSAWTKRRTNKRVLSEENARPLGRRQAQAHGRRSTAVPRPPGPGEWTSWTTLRAERPRHARILKKGCSPARPRPRRQPP